MSRTFVVLLLAAVAGCSNRPHAPALSASPLFQDDAIGLRFRAPDGWTQFGRGTLPTGKIPKEAEVVGYRLMYGDKPAKFNVTAADLPEGTDLAQHLALAPWRVTAGPLPETVGGKPGLRFALADQSQRRETVAVRRGSRVYFFTLSFGNGDRAAPASGREILATVTWKD